jgi:hypothetical protein
MIGETEGRTRTDRALQAGLLLVLAILFLGLPPYMRVASGALYGAFAVAALVLAGLMLWTTRDGAGDARDPFALLRAAAPILAFMAAYFVWGALVSSNRRGALAPALHGIGLGVLIALVVGAILVREGGLGRLADLVQVATLVGLAVSVLEYLHPQLIFDLARLILAPDVRSYNGERPAGLWLNPNEAGFAFLLSWLVAPWARQRLRWIGRAAAVAGIYLTASRTALYLLLLAAVIEVVVMTWRWKHPRREARDTVIAALAGLMVAALLLPLLAVSLNFALRHLPAGLPGVSAAAGFGANAGRFLDVTQSTRARDDRSRVELFQYWARKGLQKPWVGSGLLSFQGDSDHQGAHDLYLMVWGEAGVLILAAFLLVLGIGLRRVLKSRAPPLDRFHLLVLWGTFLLLGLSWHNQFFDVIGVLWLLLLYQVPALWPERDHVVSRGPAVYQSASLSADRSSVN